MKKETYILIIILFVSFSSCETKKEQSPTKQSNKIDEVSIQKRHDSLDQIQKIKEVLKEKDTHSLKNAKVYNPFLELDIDEVIAYDYETHMDTEMPYIIDNKGRLNPTVTKQKNLTQTQITTLKIFLGSVETYGNAKATCYEPHLGIVFYKDKKVVAHVSICISCNHLASSLEIPATTYRGYRTDGFNPKAIEFLNDFCQSLEFSYCKN
ncbi:hypothetical protein C8N46_10341 [Kordia periserrulae]|uniref:Uncharacterized protein n=1 Tax=Kordia periserrulae TaxID=701523 RepID=A0A2T6C0T3_9FLAO|nr:hypothetical protein [Kordia periserrulae]PTX61944.1 hypothetical protein C8N46_10341 [Kordia periserrulae]